MPLPEQPVVVGDVASLLRRKRADFEQEAIWHKFLIDACYGTGGFRGRIAPPEVSVLGWAARLYDQYTAAPSYLDQFKREDKEKFESRIKVSSYRNYVGPFVELIVGFVNKHEMARTEEGDGLAEWRADADGNSTTWETLRDETVRATAARLGYCPVLFDMPATLADEETEEMSLAQREQLRSDISPRAIPLFPINLLDWECDDTGAFVWAKIRTDHEVRLDAMHEKVCEERYSIWYRDRVEKYVIRRGVNVSEAIEGPEVIAHTWGQVPIVVFRGEPTPGERVRGRSIVSDAAVEARSHFNIASEKREHERGQVFAILGVPVSDMKADVGKILVGNHNAIKVPEKSNMPLHYVAPPASVAESLETSMGASVKEMYRISRIEYEAPTRADTSGIARAYQFEQTNSRLRALAGGWARSEQEALRLVAKALGDKKSEKMTVTAPSDFSVEDLVTDLQNVASVLEQPIGDTARGEILKRTVDKVAPNMTQEQRLAVASEIDDELLQAEQDDALAKEAERAALDQSKNRDNGQGGEPGKKNEAA